MNGYKIPLSLLKEKTYLADKYFSERFPTPTLEKTENPNFEISGCGVSMNATETEQSFNITDPSDSSKVLCEMIYSTEGIKFRYPNTDMVNNVIDVGIGSNEKLDILSNSLTAIKNNFSLKYGGAYEITDEIGELNSICYGNGKFVAGAYEGNYCCYSTDGGDTWTKSVIDENATTAVWDICYGNNKFVAVADGYLMYSTNGINWTKSKDTDRYWKSVCYGNDKFVAVADNGCITYSNDGITWNEEIISNTPQWYSVCYGNDKFIAVSCDGIVAYSEDGNDWIPYSLQIDIAAWMVEYTEDKFIITCENTDSGYLMLYSYDGLNWTNLYDKTAYGAVYSDNGKYLLGGADGACKYSYDGILWKTVTDVPSDMIIHGICNIPGSDRFICVGSGILSVTIPDNYKKGTRSELAVTYNWTNAPEGFLLPETETYLPGTNVTVDTYYNDKTVYDSFIFNNWTEGTMPSSNLWNSVCYGNDKYVAVVYRSNIFAYSNDGITWTEGDMLNDGYWYSVCYGNGKFVAVGNSATAYSTDGINWTEGTISSGAWRSVCYGNGKYVVVDSSSAAYSIDGITWITNDIGTGSAKGWHTVCYGDGKFVAVDHYGDAAYSNDGITWEIIGFAGSYMETAQICYGNDKYVITAFGINTAWYSTDGISWMETMINPENDKYESHGWTGIYYGNGKYVAVSSDGYYAYSYDGINWIENAIENKNTKYWASICYNNHTFLIISSGDICITHDSNLIKFSGWNTTNFTIMEDTNISGTWASIENLPDNAVFVNGNLDNRLLKIVTYNINIPDDNITETVTVELPNDKKYISSISGDNSNISVNIPSITPTPSLLKGSNYYYTFEGFTSDDVNVTSDS